MPSLGSRVVIGGREGSWFLLTSEVVVVVYYVLSAESLSVVEVLLSEAVELLVDYDDLLPASLSEAVVDDVLVLSVVVVDDVSFFELESLPDEEPPPASVSPPEPPSSVLVDVD